MPDSPIDMGAIPFFEPREGRCARQPAAMLSRVLGIAAAGVFHHTRMRMHTHMHMRMQTGSMLGALPLIQIVHLPARLPRPSEHPAEWLRGPVAGTRYETHVTAGGAGLSAMSESPVSAWAPPAPPAGHELLLLPDEMYAVVPSGVGSGTDACGAGGGVVFEFGGRMRDGRGLRRVRTEYAAGGAVKGFAYEALTCGA